MLAFDNSIFVFKLLVSLFLDASYIIVYKMSISSGNF